MQPRTLIKVLATALVLMSMSAQAEEPAFAAKSLFFGEDGDVKAVATSKSIPTESAAKAPAKSEGKAVVIATTAKKTPEKTLAAAKKGSKDLSIGAAYFVRLKKDGAAPEDVIATRMFSTGDKFQLGLKVNRPSYVYIFNEDSDGRITKLHPRPGRTAAIDAMGTVFLPSQGTFQFEGPAGTEKLLVLMSDEEMFQPDAEIHKLKPDLVTRAVYTVPVNAAPAAPAAAELEDCNVMVADAGGYASKAIVFADETNTARNNCMPSAAPAFASKAIVFSDDPEPATGQQVASYVVKPQGSANKKEPLLLKIQLTHR